MRNFLRKLQNRQTTLWQFCDLIQQQNIFIKIIQPNIIQGNKKNCKMYTSCPLKIYLEVIDTEKYLYSQLSIIIQQLLNKNYNWDFDLSYQCIYMDFNKRYWYENQSFTTILIRTEKFQKCNLKNNFSRPKTFFKLLPKMK